MKGFFRDFHLRCLCLGFLFSVFMQFMLNYVRNKMKILTKM